MIDRDTFASMRKLAEYRSGRAPMDRDIEIPIRLASTAKSYLRAYGKVTEEEGKSVRIVHLTGRDPFDRLMRFVWRLKDIEVEVDPDSMDIRSIGDLNHGLIIEGYELVEVEYSNRSGFMSHKLPTLDLPRVARSQRYLEIEVDHGADNLNSTLDALWDSFPARESLFEMAQTKSFISRSEGLSL